MDARNMCCIVGLLASTMCCMAQDQMDAGTLAKMARDTGKTTTAILIGPAADYLHQSFQTNATIYADASVIKKIDDRCNRMKFVFRMPDFEITVKNPVNSQETKSGPFESVAEINFCN